MGNKTTIIFSSELNKVFFEANELALSNNYAELPVEVLYYVIIKTYIRKDIEDLECYSFKRLIQKLSDSERASLLETAEKEYKKAKTQTFELPDEYKSKFLPYSQVLAAVVKSANETVKMAGEKFGIVELGMAEFLMAMYSVCEDVVPMAGDSGIIASKYGLGRFQFMSQILMDGTDSKVINPKLSKNGNMKFEERRIEPPADWKKDEGGNESGSGFEPTTGNTAMSSRKADPNSKTPILDQFATNMTKNAEDGLYDPVVGRDKELRELINILCCRKKNNGVLLGDPGCGKTAIVECLAQKIANNDVPRELKGHKIMSLSTTDLLAGTMYRGQAEERVQKLCKELKENRDIILYMDEFHQATSENQTSISDMLKPALGRGELTMIASTTVAEYKKYIEKDGALKRRFQKVFVEEPTLEDTMNILKSLAPKYEKYHHVKYTEEVLKACAEWSDKYIYDRKSPDKAIDLMDTSGARTKLDNPLNLTVIEGLEKEINELVEKKNAEVFDDNLEEALKTRNTINEKREQLKNLQTSAETDDSIWPEVSLDCVANVVSDLTNIPADKINNPEISKLKTMREELLKKVIGQDESIKAVSLSLSKSFLGLRDESKPIACLMFVGPTGVGKTLLCEEICNTVYGDKKAMLRIDCGEYAAEHTVTKLIGAPASYVGYGEPGLFDSIRERPNSLVLFDEIEKMHPSIINTIFLNLMSTGMVKMSNGVEVSFRNCIIVFTGNVGTKELQIHGDGIGFGTKTVSEKKKVNEEIVNRAIKKQFRPEFINRLTGTVIFNELGKEEMDKIFDLELAKLQDRLTKKGLSLTVTEELKKFIIEQTDTKYGARDLSRGITKFVEDKICESMLMEDISGKNTITAELSSEESKIMFSV